MIRNLSAPLPDVRDSPRSLLGGFDHTEQRREMARLALQKAEEIQPNAGEVLWMKGEFAYHAYRDYDRALAELNQANQRLPNEARIYMLTGAIDRRSVALPKRNLISDGP